MFQNIGSMGKKICYIGHRKFLPQTHHFRKQKKAFNGEEEHVKAPKPLLGAEVLDSLLGVEVVFVRFCALRLDTFDIFTTF